MGYFYGCCLLVLEGFGLVSSGYSPAMRDEEGVREPREPVGESDRWGNWELWSEIDMGDMGEWRSPPLGEWGS